MEIFLKNSFKQGFLLQLACNFKRDNLLRWGINTFITNMRYYRMLCRCNWILFGLIV